MTISPEVKRMLEMEIGASTVSYNVKTDGSSSKTDMDTAKDKFSKDAQMGISKNAKDKDLNDKSMNNFNQMQKRKNNREGQNKLIRQNDMQETSKPNLKVQHRSRSGSLLSSEADLKINKTLSDQSNYNQSQRLTSKTWDSQKNHYGSVNKEIDDKNYRNKMWQAHS